MCAKGTIFSQKLAERLTAPELDALHSSIEALNAEARWYKQSSVSPREKLIDWKLMDKQHKGHFVLGARENIIGR